MLNKYCIDLVKTNQYISKPKRINGGPAPIKRVYKTSNIGAIASMADGVITYHMQRNIIVGIKACIEHRIRHATFKNYLGSIPLWSDKIFPDYGEQERQMISLATDSLIATVIIYGAQLSQHHSNLSGNILSELTADLECCLRWAP